MTAAIFIVAVALAKILLGVLAARPGALGRSSPSRQDTEEEEDFAPVLGGEQFEDYPTGNLPSEEYSSAAGSRQAFGDFRDPDESLEHQFSDCSDQSDTHSQFDYRSSL
jgi:hypothetical protein